MLVTAMTSPLSNPVCGVARRAEVPVRAEAGSLPAEPVEEKITGYLMSPSARARLTASARL